ncbi:GerAB/ArcD/ProY family transporter [Bacillus sp. ISL-4]|uniref:GerAB/ArcD/ProY family transporter n=1 Tax=Bacillus sp. ISL-4 TaxID=2819125 RepID=UPI001BEB6148|nr:GerAB/ArcD/ProY family transporter [Bacillus sp. ISL-4]MBT2668510.1 GerAB/ArcD/ProY family transporter [Bacillus sp. ISL-4]MBT2675063.1 GerAB/ArcD/ProY family transporter [Streptomyces sp. ISL-14]
MKVKTRINHADLFFLLVQTMVGVGILSLPFQTYKTAAQDGWISVLLSGFMIQLIVLLMWLLCKRFPHLTLFDFSKLILGKTLGNIINFLYIVYLLTIVSYVFIVIDDIFVRWIFPETPKMVLLIMGLVLLFYGCIGTIRNMVSLFSFLFIFILFLFFITLLTFQNSAFDFRYLFPIGSSGIWKILKGTKDAFPSFTGYETLLIYFAFIKQPKNFSAIKGASFAIFFVTILYTYIVIITTMMFSPAEIKIVPEPVLYMLRTINMHVLQRLDLIFLSIWGVVVSTSILSYAYLGSMGISKLLRMKHKLAVILSSAVVFFVSITCHLYLEIITFRKWIEILNLTFGILIPAILLLIAIIFKREASSFYEEK